LRALLVRLDDQEHILFKVIHHIASDGWSSGILWRELGQYYREARSGTHSDADLPIQYQDYAAWQLSGCGRNLRNPALVLAQTT
jgi:hypothetical protein